MSKKNTENFYQEGEGKFWDVFRSLSGKELLLFSKWLKADAPEGVETERMLRLIDNPQISSKLSPKNEKKWAAIMKELAVNQANINRLASNINPYLEDFLAFQELEKHTDLKKQLLVANYTQRNIPKRRKELIDLWEEEVKKMSQKDIEYYDQMTRIYKYKKENLILSGQLKDRQAHDDEMYEFWEIRLFMDYFYWLCCISEANRSGKKRILPIFTLDNKEFISTLLKERRVKKYPALYLILNIADLSLWGPAVIPEKMLEIAMKLFEDNAHLLAKDVSQNLFRILLKMIHRNPDFHKKTNPIWRFFTTGIEKEWLLINGKLSLDVYMYVVRIAERKKKNAHDAPSIEAFLEKNKEKWQEHAQYTTDIKQLMSLEDLYAAKKYWDVVREGMKYTFTHFWEETNAKVLIAISWYLYSKGKGVTTVSVPIKQVDEEGDKMKHFVKELERKTIQKFDKENITEQALERRNMYLQIIEAFHLLFEQDHAPKNKVSKKRGKLAFAQNIHALVETNYFFTYQWAWTLYEELGLGNNRKLM